MTDMGLMYYFLGIETHQTDAGIFITQKKYASGILKRFKMDSCKPILTPMEERLELTKERTGSLVDSTLYKKIMGCLRYLTASRTDIVYSVGILS